MQVLVRFDAEENNWYIADVEDGGPMIQGFNNTSMYRRFETKEQAEAYIENKGGEAVFD